MGIYSREPVDLGPTSKSGLGSVPLVSFNTWIIGINIAVFVLNLFFSGAARPVLIDRQIAKGFESRDLMVDQSFVDPRGLPVRPGPFPPGVVLHRRLFDAATGQEVGQEQFLTMTAPHDLGHFSTARGFFGLEVWRLVTFQFLHANLTHLVFNMVGLYMFGGLVEGVLGPRRYAAFYLVCGIFGALLYLALNLLGAVFHLRLPGVLTDSAWMPLIGASAGVFGVIMACAFIAPRAIIQLVFPPIRVPMWVTAYGYFLVALSNLLLSGKNAGGDAAHVGGALAGAYFIRHAHHLRDFFDFTGSARRGPGSRDGLEADELDRILAKARRVGLRHLDESERARLRRAAERRSE